MSRTIVFYYKGTEISYEGLEKLTQQITAPLKSSYDGIIETLIDNGTSRFFIIKNFTPDYFDHFQKLSHTLEHEPPIVVFGKQCNQKRNVGFFSNESDGYNYSKQTMKSQPLKNKLMIDIMAKVNDVLNTKFNGILFNQYIDGTKTVGSHSDDEKGLDAKKSCVAGIAYGATRLFRIRDIKTNEIVLDHYHEPCSLIVMDGDFQKEYKHEIPQQKKVKDIRISLTFRSHTV